MLICVIILKYVNEGEEVVLESVIVSTPPPKVFWYRNNIPIVETDQFQIKHYGDIFKLILKHVTMQDFAGEYKVRAENIAGECQSTCTVHVNKPGTMKPNDIVTKAVSFYYEMIFELNKLEYLKLNSMWTQICQVAQKYAID